MMNEKQPPNVSEWSPNDLDAEDAADYAAAAGKWEAFAQPGYEKSTRELTIDTAHDAAAYEDAMREALKYFPDEDADEELVYDNSEQLDWSELSDDEKQDALKRIEQARHDYEKESEQQEQLYTKEVDQ